MSEDIVKMQAFLTLKRSVPIATNNAMFTPDGLLLICGSSQKLHFFHGETLVHLSSIATGRLASQPNGYPIAVTPDGRQLILPADGLALRAISMPHTETSDIAAPIIRSLNPEDHTSSKDALKAAHGLYDAISLVSQLGGSSLGAFGSAGSLNTVIWWIMSFWFPYHTARIAISSSGKFLASLTFKNRVLIWNTQPFALRAALRGYTHFTQFGTTDLPYCTQIQFSPDERQVHYLFKDQIWTIDTLTGEISSKVNLPTIQSSGGDLSPNGRFFAESLNSRCCIWDFAESRQSANLLVSKKWFASDSRSLFSRCGRWLITTANREAKLWSTETWTERASVPLSHTTHQMLLSNNGKRLIIPDGKAINEYQVSLPS